MALDRAPPSARSAFIRAKKVEQGYAKRLRSVARTIGEFIRGHAPTDLAGASRLAQALRSYADTLTGWAESVGGTMVAEVNQRDERSWFKIADTMGKELKKEIATAPTGRVMQERMREQVTLIKSLPLDAAQRVHDMTLEGITKGWRPDRISAEIMKTGEVTKSRANLIARTEVGRTSTLLTQSRAEHVGSTGYIWRTSQDNDVRKSHKAMQGKFVAWDEPPTLDGMSGHAGALPNCRCYPEPVIPD